MSGKFLKSVVNEQHKLIKSKNVQITTIAKSNKKKIKASELRMIGEGLLKKAKKGSRLMVKVLSNNKGYFQLKSYDEGMEAILDPDKYVNGREGIEAYSIYKASFYIL